MTWPYRSAWRRARRMRTSFVPCCVTGWSKSTLCWSGSPSWTRPGTRYKPSPTGRGAAPQRPEAMKLVILDRDGTINADSDEFIKSPEEWMPLPGALEAIARLNHAGWHVVIASNQSGLGRGLFDVASLNAMHAKMHKMLSAQGGRIDAVFYCPHSAEEGCQCRKPLPGLFEQ